MVKKTALQRSIEEARRLRQSAEQVLEKSRLLREELARQKEERQFLRPKGWRV
jgi:hypothetical protein